LQRKLLRITEASDLRSRVQPAYPEKVMPDSTVKKTPRPIYREERTNGSRPRKKTSQEEATSYLRVADNFRGEKGGWCTERENE